MSIIRVNIIDAATDRAYALVDYSICNTITKQYEFTKQILLADKSLTEVEKSIAIKSVTKDHDYDKIRFNEGPKRICENCEKECLATLFCEICIRNHLKAKFSDWTSGNNDIDDLIQECQMKSIVMDRIVEWIPYKKLRNIKYLTKGGCSEVYTTDWIDGNYDKWDSKNQQLTRYGKKEVILKTLENVERADRSWLEEAKSHLTISNKWINIVKCHGLTQDPSNGKYMLVMRKLNMDLRKYLQENYNKLTWKERTNIIVYISNALLNICREKEIHKDLHSGNILYFQHTNSWFISDLGFCGPASKPLKSIYGNLPYIAPEVINGEKHTFASDIYSIGMLMWEVSSGKPPFANYEHDYDLATNIVNGKRPEIIPNTPLEYEELMVQCWNDDPTKRPNIVMFDLLIGEIYKSYYQHKNEEQVLKDRAYNAQLSKSNSMSKNHTSKVYTFEPKNETEVGQEAFHSKSYSFNIPENIADINKSNNQNNVANSSKISSTPKTDDSFKDNQNNYEGEIIQQMKKKTIVIDDEEEIYNNPNLHSEEQDEFEIPDDGF